MNIADIIVILFLALSVAGAVLLMRRGRRGCGHGCSGCSGCPKKEKRK